MPKLDLDCVLELDRRENYKNNINNSHNLSSSSSASNNSKSQNKSNIMNGPEIVINDEETESMLHDLDKALVVNENSQESDILN